MGIIKVERMRKSLKVEAFEPDVCPLCKNGIPITKPGASDKKT